jgi:hypothetical protein
MPIKYFENVYDGNATNVIGINSDHVLSVYEQDVPDPKDKKGKKTIRVTNLYTLNGTNFSVNNKMIEVVAILNEKN